MRNLISQALQNLFDDPDDRGTFARDSQPPNTRRQGANESSTAEDAGHHDADNEHSQQFAALPVILMTQTAHRDMMEYLTSHDPEVGGMLAGPQGQDLITHFIEDTTARTTGASYSPDAPSLNQVLKKFLACRMDAKGLAHSHPAGCTRPSLGDLAHVQSTFARAKNARADVYFLPIVCEKRLYPYVVTRDEPERVQLAQLVII